MLRQSNHEGSAKDDTVEAPDASLLKALTEGSSNDDDGVSEGNADAGTALPAFAVSERGKSIKYNTIYNHIFHIPSSQSNMVQNC